MSTEKQTKTKKGKTVVVGETIPTADATTTTEVVTEVKTEEVPTETPTADATPATEVAEPKKLGRPIVEGSVRQQKLAERAAKIEAEGGIKRGRPVKGDSARQERLKKRQEKIAAGIPIAPGRPKGSGVKKEEVVVTATVEPTAPVVTEQTPVVTDVVVA